MISEQGATRGEAGKVGIVFGRGESSLGPKVVRVIKALYSGSDRNRSSSSSRRCSHQHPF